MKSIHKITSMIMVMLFGIPMLAQNIDCQTRNQNFRSLRNTVVVQNVNQPFSAQEIADFQGLFYYPVNCEDLVSGRLHKHDQMKLVTVETTKGEMVSVYDYGTVNIKLGGEEYSFQVYQNVDIPDFAGAATIFIPIKDETSGQSTFEHGRYLIIQPEGNEVSIDLNMAINPWENYNSNYSTLIVPASNVIRAPVPVGERKYEDR